MNNPLIPSALYLYSEFLAYNIHIYHLLLSSNPYIPPWLEKVFEFKVFILLNNASASQKIKCRYFYSCPPGKTLPLLEGNYSFLTVFFFWEKGRGTIQPHWPLWDEFLEVYNVHIFHLFLSQSISPPQI